MNHISVSSSTLYSVGFDRARCVMQVTFRDSSGKPTSTYEYTHVLPEDVTDLLFAESKGRHFAKHVKGKFPMEKLAVVVTPWVGKVAS